MRQRDFDNVMKLAAVGCLIVLAIAVGHLAGWW